MLLPITVIRMGKTKMAKNKSFTARTSSNGATKLFCNDSALHKTAKQTCKHTDPPSILPCLSLPTRTEQNKLPLLASVKIHHVAGETINTSVKLSMHNYSRGMI